MERSGALHVLSNNAAVLWRDRDGSVLEIDEASETGTELVVDGGAVVAGPGPAAILRPWRGNASSCARPD